MKKNNIYFYILVLFSFFVISYLICTKTFQNDTYYTIKVGESIFKHGVDMKDHFSFIPNLAYSYPHWLYDSFIYLIYSIGGFRLIYLSTILLGFILLTTIYFCSIKIGNNKYVSYLVIMFLSFFLGGYFTARAQMFSYISFVIILYSLEMLRKTDKKRYILYLFLSSLIIANMHAAVWPFVFVLFLPFIVQDLIYLLVKKLKINFQSLFNIDLEKSKLKITMIAFLICIVTGFLSPNFLVPFTYLINTVSGVSLSHISEHSAINISDYLYIYLFVFATIVLLLSKKTKIKLRDLFLLIGLFILAFSSIKNIALFLLLSMFSYSRLFSSFDFSSIEPSLWNKYFISILLILFVFALFVTYNSNTKKEYIKESSYPVDASKFIKENLDYKNKRIFNQYDYGSYLLYEDIPVFIDSRADLYLKEFNKNCNVFEDYFDSKANYKFYFNKYDIKYVILKKNTPLYTTILKYEDYKKIYSDEYFIIYELGD